MIIVSVTGPTMTSALEQMKSTRPFADMFEVRLDLIANPVFSRLLGAARRPVIATCRPRWEGGRFAGPESKRITILERALSDGAAYVDLELAVGASVISRFVRRTRGRRVIVSKHLFSLVSLDSAKIYSDLRATGADVVKFAYTARDAPDIRHAAEFLKRAAVDHQKAIAVAMSDYGEASRVLYKKFGGWATYAAPEKGEMAAPGQIRARDLKQVYRADKLTCKTRVFGVLGNPLGQSKGVYIHNVMFRRESLDAVYCRFLTESLEKFMIHVAPILSGFSVTIPFKEKILRYLDRVDPLAQKIGAVNTVLHRRSAFFGTNTDAAAALDAIERTGQVRGKRVLILGAGGAARAIAYETLRREAEVLLANRTESRARKLVSELKSATRGRRVRGISVSEMRRTPFDILVNATPVGMVPHVQTSPVSRSMLKGKVVFDAVYNPPVTKLLKDGQKAGARTVSGTQMYVNQAAAQFELYTGITPSRGVMNRILRERLRNHA